MEWILAEFYIAKVESKKKKWILTNEKIVLHAFLQRYETNGNCMQQLVEERWKVCMT